MRKKAAHFLLVNAERSQRAVNLSTGAGSSSEMLAVYVGSHWNLLADHVLALTATVSKEMLLLQTSPTATV